jgi:two-component system cell cycle sensor histidine kinase/response regulator CckA
VLGLGDVEYGADGTPRRMVGAIKDITERKQAEQTLHDSVAHYREMFEANPNVMWVFDSETLRFLAVNDAAVAHYGYSRDQFLSMTVADIRPPEDLPHLRDAIARSEQTAGIDHVGARHRKQDGTLIDVEVTSHEMDFGGRRARVVTVNDTSERKKADAVRAHLEAQLRHSQKMEAVGQLAGGIAHDFNNLLTIIMTTADLASADLNQDDPLRRELEEIRSAAGRAAALTGQLLAFSRRQILKADVVQLNTLIANLQPMLARVLGADLKLAVVADESLGCVRADAGQLEQVIMNFAINARDAMPSGGTLTFKTRNVDSDAAYVALHPSMRPGPHVMLTVSDTGVGMDEATREHIFEPFFTTKELGKGTGLGLSTVFGIVEQSGGSIEVTSELGRGTTFTIWLPRVDAVQPPDARPTPTSVSGNETILIVEDDAAVLRMGARILGPAGYTVLTAGNGLEALGLLARYEGPVHVLLTDVVMPRMGGRELAERVAEIRPEIKVLFTSGYTDDEVLRDGVLDRAARFIGKPYRASDLRRAIREALDAPGHHARA